MRNIITRAALLILLLGCAEFPVFAAIQIADEGFYLDLPEGYHEISEGTGGRYQPPRRPCSRFSPTTASATPKRMPSWMT
jgi:hypothetical protein